MMVQRDDESRWHLDKRVPLALIITIAMQSVGAVWWAATMQSRIGVLEEKLASTNGQGERIVRLEEDISHIRQTLERIERAITKSASSGFP